MYVCFNGGGGGAFAFWKIFQPFGHGILLEKIGLPWRVKTQILDEIFFQRVTVFTFFSCMLFYICPSRVWQSSVSAGFFLDFDCVTFLSDDKPQIFGFIVTKSGPRRWLTLLCSGFFTPDERWGRENLGLNWSRRDLYN